MLCEVLLDVLEYFVIFCSGPAGEVPGRSGTGDVSTEVVTDMPVSKKRAVVTRRSIPPAGDGRRPANSNVPVLERSR